MGTTLNITTKRSGSVVMHETLRLGVPGSNPMAGMGGSPCELSEELVTKEKQKRDCRMNLDLGEATEGLENEL